MTAEFDLAGKRMLITGAASGIGREFAQLAAEAGASLALLDVNTDGLEETAQSLAEDAKVEIIPVDLTEWAAVEQAVNRANAAMGGIDVACNVAGWSKPGPFWEQPIDLWQKIVDINIWSTLHISRAVAPILIEQGSGTIVNVSGRVGSKGETVYAMTKGAIIALTKSLARELAAYGVTVNCLCPGPTTTPLLQTNAGTNPSLMEKMARAIPLKRVGVPRDQALALAFLSSDAASYMTGQVISVSGGLTMVD